MALSNEDPFAPVKKQPGHEIGEPLDAISVEELSERIDMLKGEIMRLEEMVEAKQASKQAAESFFKT